jgi:hypothetical protein
MFKKKPKKRGRPSLPKYRAKAESVTVRLQPGEKAAFKAAARIAGIKLSEWIRRSLKTALSTTSM